MRIAWSAAVALLLLASPTAARADERILRFLSDIRVQKDSSVDVIETIDIRAEHDRINHGIYRDFPTRYRGPHGTQFHVGFTFEGATLDGQPVRSSVEPSGGGVRIKLGDPESYVDVGEHIYTIHYRATREIGQFQDFDELYWNVTGNQWIFPIDEAEARIRLPSPVPFVRHAFYTGPQGATASNAEVIDEQPGEISFRTTAPLNSYEGLTVAAAFPKGVVAVPAGGGAMELMEDYGPPLLGLLGLLGLCGFYFVAWQRAGRDPRAGTVVPIFTPPDGLSPAGMRYIVRMNADNRAFAAALVDAAVRGHLRLVEEKAGWLSSTRRTVERLSSDEPLPHDEQEMVDRLGEPGDSIEMKQENHEIFSSAMSALTRALDGQYKDKLFHRNLGWAAAGVMIFAAVLWLVAASVVLASGGGNGLMVGVIFGILAAAALLWIAFHETAVGKCLLTLMTAAAIPVVFTLGMPILGEALNSGWYLPFILPALAAPLVLSAFWWISAPTPEGRKALDHIAGFKQYLSIAEGERLDRMTNPPKDTPELFEKYLPYAIALGVENRWASRFESVLAAASTRGQQGFAWYSGSGSPWSNPSGFVDNVGSSLSSAVGSASTAPGSGGGGSSGGGGGGGGGGGW